MGMGALLTSIILTVPGLCSSTPVDSSPSARLVRRSDLPNVPPLVAPNINDCHFQYFTQKVDHFDQHNGTFEQKYNLVKDYFKPGGPILLFQGEESTYLDCVVRCPSSLAPIVKLTVT